MARYLYSELARLTHARKNCIASHNEWADKHEETILKLVADHMPSGFGFDSGTKIDLDASHANKLVFDTSFHHMDDGGFYAGWTEHRVTVTPSLKSNFDLRISGRDTNHIKEMMYDEFDYQLRQDVTYDLYCEFEPKFKLRHTWENEDGTPSQCYQAWYVEDVRFWNKHQEARDYAGQKMYEAFMSRSKQDDSLCTCANRSWYGEEHDSACELEGKR